MTAGMQHGQSSHVLVTDFLEQSADRLPDKVALVCDGKRLTYRDLERRSNQFANMLISRGIRRGDRVILYLPNSIELVVGIFGTMKAGGVFVVVNSTTKDDKLAYIIQNAGARVCLSWPAKAELLGRLLANSTSLEIGIVTSSAPQPGTENSLYNFEGELDNQPVSRPEPSCIDLDLACLIYTSGSTGEAKGVMSDHSNVVFAAHSITSYLENVEQDIVIGILPLSFDYGLYQLLMVFSFGGTLVLERGFTYPAQILQHIADERVTGFPGVPTLFSVLLSMDLSEYDLSSIRYITNTAAALPPSHITRLREKFPGVRLFSMYGLTETKRTLYLPPEELDRRPDSVGIAIPGTEVWLVDEDGNRLPPGTSGELVVRGRHVMRGYWQSPEESAARFRPGALPGERICYTGDLFRSDHEGFMYFVGRKDDIIKSRGEKVAPKEVENVLFSLPGIKEAAVVGVEDPVLGQAVKAFVVPADADLTVSEVLRYCRSHLEDYMVPKHIEICDELPKTSSGKIQKRGLN